MTRPRFLVVEDDPNGQTITCELLEFAHLEVDVADDAEAALELLANHDYSLAIVDLSLPGMSSWELLRQIRQTPSTTDMPCFAVTAYHSPQVAQKAREAGFSAYFSKPIDVDILYHEIAQYLDK